MSDAEAGPATAPKQGQGEQHATLTDQIGYELMRRRSSSTGTENLIGGDTLAGRGAAIAASFVKLHA